MKKEGHEMELEHPEDRVGLLSNEDQAETLAHAGREVQLTVRSAHLQRRYRVIGFFTFGVPLLGSGFALWSLRWGSVPTAIWIVTVFCYFWTLVGLEVGYHRCFSHRAFVPKLSARIFLAILGAWGASGPPTYWVATHRLHHARADREGDPHTPLLHGRGFRNRIRGMFHAHIGWMLDAEITNVPLFARELLADPLMRRMERLYPLFALSGLLFPAIVAGFWLQNWIGALQGFLWGGFVRLALVQHLYTGGLNSICHLFGGRNFHTTDGSRNNFWLSLPALGQGWHNNHHAFPNSAVVGFRWFEIDPGAWIVRAMEVATWISEVNRPHPRAIEQKKERRQ